QRTKNAIESFETRKSYCKTFCRCNNAVKMKLLSIHTLLPIYKLQILKKSILYLYLYFIHFQRKRPIQNYKYKYFK
ncbi:Uncharacterized protein APZ42_006619, partial [Daphnia magna]